MVRVLFLAPLLVLLAVPVYYVFLKGPPPLPDLALDEWWGPPDLKTKVSDEIKPFKIKFKDDKIQDLKQRLKTTRQLTPPLEGIAHEYGFNTNQIPEWLKYWAEEYNFAEREKFFNQYQHYKTNIQGLNIHFMSVSSEAPPNVEVVPVLLLHGWPGSFREFYEAVPLLAANKEGRDFALQLIIPSLPGYGFSDAAVKPGLGAPEMAVVMRNLMKRLGFQRFYLQGGDWGSLIGSSMVTLFPDEILGFHTNLAVVMSTTATLLEYLGSFYPSLIVDEALADRIYPLKEKRLEFMIQESGYMHLQSTKPDTIGVAVSDSPAGLLAYVLEKFSTWTDKNQKPLTQLFTKEQLIDNLMCYWATNSMTTAMRLYSETFNKKMLQYKMDDIPTPVPTWVMQAKYELTYTPPAILKLKYHNLVNTTILEDGGHFLAFQKPKEFAEDVLRAITEFRKITKSGKKTEL